MGPDAFHCSGCGRLRSFAKTQMRSCGPARAGVPSGGGWLGVARGVLLDGGGQARSASRDVRKCNGGSNDRTPWAGNAPPNRIRGRMPVLCSARIPLTFRLHNEV